MSSTEFTLLKKGHILQLHDKDYTYEQVLAAQPLQKGKLFIVTKSTILETLSLDLAA
jgi:hypothetical protein